MAADSSIENEMGARAKGFATTAAYDSAIARTFEMYPILQRTARSSTFRSSVTHLLSFPESLRLSYRKSTIFVTEKSAPESGAVLRWRRYRHCEWQQLQGKELSFNNIVDMQAAWDLAPNSTSPSAGLSNTPTRAEARWART